MEDYEVPDCRYNQNWDACYRMTGWLNW